MRASRSWEVQPGGIGPVLAAGVGYPEAADWLATGSALAGAAGAPELAAPGFDEPTGG